MIILLKGRADPARSAQLSAEWRCAWEERGKRNKSAEHSLIHPQAHPRGRLRRGKAARHYRPKGRAGRPGPPTCPPNGGAHGKRVERETKGRSIHLFTGKLTRGGSYGGARPPGPTVGMANPADQLSVLRARGSFRSPLLSRMARVSSTACQANALASWFVPRGRQQIVMK